MVFYSLNKDSLERMTFVDKLLMFISQIEPQAGK